MSDFHGRFAVSGSREIFRRSHENLGSILGFGLLGKRLRGDADVSSDAFAALITVFFVLGVLAILKTALIQVEAEMKTAQETLDVVDMAHFIRGCISEDGIVDSEWLERNKEKNSFREILEAGQDCRRDVSVKVTDMNDGKKWEWGHQDNGHSIFVSIRAGNEVHLGRLDVSI